MVKLIPELISHDLKKKTLMKDIRKLYNKQFVNNFIAEKHNHIQSVRHFFKKKVIWIL